MKIFSKISIVIVFIVSLAFGLAGANTASAAISPTLGASSGYSVLGATTVTNTGATVTNGSVGVSPGTAITNFPPGVAGGGLHSNDASAIAAQADNLSVFGVLDQACDQTFGSVDLTATFPTGVGPGVYCSTGSFSLTGNLNLTGSGVWIFKTASSLITSPGASVTGGDPCNVWWRVGSSATLDTSTSFIGNILALTSITFNTGATLSGRAMVQTGQVTLDANIISGPACLAVATSGTGSGPSWYSRIIPLIGITKVPSPLVLPEGAGSVTYNYTVWNIADEQALVDVTVVDDKCNPVTFLSGDSNNNSKLDQGENWKYSCTTTLLATTTNTSVATGYSDDTFHEPAVATAIATVAVGVPLTPPLINIVKVPSRLTPFPFGGGIVTYTYTVTNPGVVAMDNVIVTDDKCSSVSRTSGDSNSNNLLDVGEAWIYVCQKNVPVSTRNMATAEGRANGFIARSYAFANVLVSAPGLPNTGFSPERKCSPWAIIVLSVTLMLILTSLVVLSRKRTN